METIDDIVREMREFADTESQSIGRDVLRRSIQHFADRIKAAVKREREATCRESLQVGNAAKMREALKAVYECAKDGILTIRESAFEKVLSALAEPPRNCDLYTIEVEAGEAFIAWYNTVYDLDGDELNEVSSCDLKHNVDDILYDYIKWLFAEAKGEAK